MSRNASNITLAVALLSTLAIPADGQSLSPSAFRVRPLVGALVPTGDERAQLKDAVLVGAQGSYKINQNVAVVGALGWSQSEDKASVARPTVDLYQYDIGIEASLNNLTPTAGISTRPYAVAGGGGRTYDLRHTVGSGSQTNPLGYGAVGLDLNETTDRIGLRLEARDNVTGFRGLRGELRDRRARNDLQFAAGLTFGF
ncbi:MAG: hypothetical protein JWL61_2383 [Gemmatimonadetes bacterium]|nr:hypothetical protein [Gemmatimonadota bacterium]